MVDHAAIRQGVGERLVARPLRELSDPLHRPIERLLLPLGRAWRPVEHGGLPSGESNTPRVEAPLGQRVPWLIGLRGSPSIWMGRPFFA